MKLRNKKTGKIVCARFCGVSYIDDDDHLLKRLLRDDVNEYEYNSLTELNEEWEDYEEQKEWYWFIEDNGIIQRSCHYEDLHPTLDEARKEIGNYFETREEAEKALEKLKAIQRLKSYYIKFKLDFVKNKIDFTYRIDGTLHSSIDEERIIFEDLALLFGGEA